MQMKKRSHAFERSRKNANSKVRSRVLKNKKGEEKEKINLRWSVANQLHPLATD